jgi:predicted RNase H-like HicB family nuclease
MLFSAVAHKEDGTYVAGCPEVGTASQGKIIEEALANLKEATELYPEAFPVEVKSEPIMANFEVKTDAKASKKPSRG